MIDWLWLSLHITTTKAATKPDVVSSIRQIWTSYPTTFALRVLKFCMLESVLANMKEKEGLKNHIRHIFCFTVAEESFYNQKVLTHDPTPLLQSRRCVLVHQDGYTSRINVSQTYVHHFWSSHCCWSYLRLTELRSSPLEVMLEAPAPSMGMWTSAHLETA